MGQGEMGQGETGWGVSAPWWGGSGWLEPHSEEGQGVSAPIRHSTGWQKLPEGAVVTRARCGVSANQSQTTAIRMSSRPAPVEVWPTSCNTPAHKHTSLPELRIHFQEAFLNAFVLVCPFLSSLTLASLRTSLQRLPSTDRLNSISNTT